MGTGITEMSRGAWSSDTLRLGWFILKFLVGTGKFGVCSRKKWSTCGMIDLWNSCNKTSNFKIVTLLYLFHLCWGWDSNTLFLPINNIFDLRLCCLGGLWSHLGWFLLSPVTVKSSLLIFLNFGTRNWAHDLALVRQMLCCWIYAQTFHCLCFYNASYSQV